MIENKMQNIAAYIESEIGKGYGFTVLIYEQGKAGRMNYVSNSQRESVVEAMKEFIENTEDGYGTHKP